MNKYYVTVEFELNANTATDAEEHLYDLLGIVPDLHDTGYVITMTSEDSHFYAQENVVNE